jgi:hypothetical protein
MDVRRLALATACFGLLGLAAAAEPAATPAPAAGAASAGAAPSQADAEAQVARGTKAMHDSTADASRAVAAAVAFSQAIRYYQAVGDVDRVCDLEANIYWCKKRMTPDDVAHFTSQNQGDQGVTQALATIEAVATKTVPKEEAASYLDRAQKYAREHPQDYGQISVHYFEVAERFIGTDVSLTAQKLSLEAQQREMAQLKQDQDIERKTLFSRSDAAAGPGQHAAIPGPDAVRTAIATIRKLYRDDFAKTKAKDKRELAGKLLEQAPLSKDDPVTQYALLSEAIDLALASSDWYGVFTACDLMAQSFAGIDAKAKKKEVYARARANPVAQAILKLVDNPDDADANTVAGKYFCFDSASWDIGLPLLAHGSDHDSKAIAEMELLKPSGGPQQVELADRWYDAGHKASGATREPILERSLFWYSQAAPSITGITKTRITQRLDELIAYVANEQGVPPALMPSRLYTGTWDRYKTLFLVKAAKGPQGTMQVTTSWGNLSVTYEAPVTCDAKGVLHVDSHDAVVSGPGKGGFIPDSFTLQPNGALEQFDTRGDHNQGTFTVGQK